MNFIDSPELKHLKACLDLISTVIVLIGIPVGLIRYFLAVRKEQHDREYGTYNALDEKYLEFQRLCMEKPQLDVFDLPDQNPIQLTPEQKKQELIAFTILISIFERAFLMYQDCTTKIKRTQWEGWNSYIRSYCTRVNFQDAWRQCGNSFDAGFEAYVNTLIPH